MEVSEVLGGGAGMNNWISVQDRLPEEPADWWRVYGTRTKSVTHWMPMPDPPEDSDGQSGEKGRHSP